MKSDCMTTAHMNMEKFVHQDEGIIHVFRLPESAMSTTGMGPFQRDLPEVGGDIKKNSRDQRVIQE